MNKKFRASWRHKQIFSDIIGLKIVLFIVIIISIVTPFQLDFFHYLIKYKPVPAAMGSKV
jgi:hypothetical protein